MPYLPGFDLDRKDIRFLGTPIDLIAFKGLNGSEKWSRFHRSSKQADQSSRRAKGQSKRL